MNVSFQHNLRFPFDLKKSLSNFTFSLNVRLSIVRSYLRERQLIYREVSWPMAPRNFAEGMQSFELSKWRPAAKLKMLLDECFWFFSVLAFRSAKIIAGLRDIVDILEGRGEHYTLYTTLYLLVFVKSSCGTRNYRFKCWYETLANARQGCGLLTKISIVNLFCIFE